MIQVWNSYIFFSCKLHLVLTHLFKVKYEWGKFNYRCHWRQNHYDKSSRNLVVDWFFPLHTNLNLINIQSTVHVMRRFITKDFRSPISHILYFCNICSNLKHSLDRPMKIYIFTSEREWNFVKRLMHEFFFRKCKCDNEQK